MNKISSLQENKFIRPLSSIRKEKKGVEAMNSKITQAQKIMTNFSNNGFPPNTRMSQRLQKSKKTRF